MITMMMMLKTTMRMMMKMTIETIETNLKEIGETVTQRCRLDPQAVNDTVTAFIIIVIIVIIVIVVIVVIVVIIIIMIIIMTVTGTHPPVNSERSVSAMWSSSC